MSGHKSALGLEAVESVITVSDCTESSVREDGRPDAAHSCSQNRSEPR